MAAKSVSNAKNGMARAVDSILDPWPTSKDPIWDFFGSECAYCGVKLVEGERLGHIDHAAPKAGNHMGNLVLACSVCNGDEKPKSSTWTGVSSSSRRSATNRCVKSASSGSSDGRRSTRSPIWPLHRKLPRPRRSCGQ